MNSLYVTDLDGTLLNSTGVLSKKTIQILSSLLQEHLPLTIATARTPLGISNILKELPLSLPMILLNGALIWNPITETVIDSSPFLEYQKLELLKIEQDYGISGFYISEKENTCQFHLHRETPEWMHYFESHSFPIPDFSPLESAPLLFASFCDSKEDTLTEIYNHLKKDSNYYLDFYKDKYLPDMWFLEIYFSHATKGSALKKIRNLLAHPFVTAFGDSFNDLPLFEEADSCCAVSNAVPALKEIADQILLSNEENGVARYLQQSDKTNHLLQQAKGSHSIVSVPSAILEQFQLSAPNSRDWISILDKQKKHRNLVYILLDGLGSNILKKHLPADSFLRKHHIMELYSVFPPTTTAAATALETGLFPSQSGYLGWSVYWPSLHKNVQLYPNVTDSGEAAAPIHLAETLLYRPFITDTIRQNTGLPTSFLSYSDFSLEKLEQDVTTLTNEDGPHVIYVYANNPDSLLHKHGTASEDVTIFLQKANAVMQRLASNCPDTQFLLTSDHGFIDVHPLCLEDYPELLELLVRPPSIEPRALNLFVKKGAEKEFCKRFHQITNNTYRLYTKQEVIEKELFGFQPYHPLFLDMLGDFLAVAQTPLTLFPNRSYLSSMVATHGGATADELIVPLIVWEHL